ncbi:MAG: CoA transferase, partial [Chloroflexota bacterium]|nr:CoA transferase [Chloroflexota bacterium]
DIVNDEHYRARGDLIPVPDEKLGSILMPGVVPKISGQTSTPAHAGPSRGAHNDQVYGEMLGLDRQTIERLRENKII